MKIAYNPPHVRRDEDNEDLVDEVARVDGLNNTLMVSVGRRRL